jgi:hypothetical protein
LATSLNFSASSQEKLIPKTDPVPISVVMKPSLETMLHLKDDKISFQNMNKTSLDIPVVIGIGAVTAGGIVLINQNYIHQKWWPYRGKWHVDFANAKDGNWFDKLGHMTAWYMIADGVRELYKIAGMNDDDARLTGLIYAAGLHLFTEGHEGYGPHFGFDPLDVTFGVGFGAGLMFMQGKSDFFRRISMKMSYWPDPSHANHPMYKNSKTQEYHWMKDYEAQRYWLSYDIKDGWSVAIGANLDDFLMNRGKWQIYISPDYDLKQIDAGSEILNDALSFLNLVKLPTPAIRIYPKFGFYLTAYTKFPTIE